MPVSPATLMSALAALLLVWPAAGQPNIVLIMADDLGYGDLSCYGSELVDTPHIDALAAEGLRFTDYHSNGAVCSPTRAALMTGRYPQRTGVEGVITAANHRAVGLPLDEYTVAEMLRDAGYATAMFGKWHLGYDVAAFGPLRQGFETFEGFVSGNVDYFNKIDQEGYKDWWIGEALEHVDGYVTDLINDRGVAWIGAQQEQDAEKPFFLYLAHGAPHYPLQGPDGEGFREVGRRVGQPPVDREATYRAMIESMDAGIGRVLDALERHGLAEDTLVIFCSDNGQAGGGPGSAGPWRGSKATVYEGGHRVPMVMRWPAQLAPGVVCDEVAVGMDLLPTFAALAGVSLPEGVAIDGEVLHALVPDAIGGPRELHWMHRNLFACRWGELVLVRRGDNAPELYNLIEDPGQSNNLAQESPEEVEHLLGLHQDWLAQAREGVEPVSR